MTIEEFKVYIQQIGNVSKIVPPSFRINSLIATSGQGVVYRGQVNGIDSAIKLYYPGHNEIRYQREIDAMKKIQSDYLVRLVDHDFVEFEENQLPLTATEFIKGETLSSRIKSGALSLSELESLCYDITQAIITLWDYEIVHRDLKPSNIMIRTDNGRACVIDLGFARHISQTTITTVYGVTYGTRGYMSPEHWAAEHDLTCKSDLFALAIILAEAAIGSHPTSWNQERLLEMRWPINLPQVFREWKHYNLFERMLDPEPSRRPYPTKITHAIRA